MNWKYLNNNRNVVAITNTIEIMELDPMYANVNKSRWSSLISSSLEGGVGEGAYKRGRRNKFLENFQ